MSAILVCPQCGSDELRSIEPTVIYYPITAHDIDGERKIGYTGDRYEVADEGTEFSDRIQCRSCLGDELPISALVTRRAYAHRDRTPEQTVSVDEDSDRGADVRFAAFCDASCGDYACGWSSRWFHADDYVDAARRANKLADAAGELRTNPGQLAFEDAEHAGREHLRAEGVLVDGS